jgi:hypothetical protein
VSELRRVPAETVGELQGGEDPSAFGARLEAGPVARREVGMQLRRHPQAALEFQIALVAAFGEDNLPSWMQRAACAERRTDKWFKDEVADLGEATVFPETVMGPMQEHCAVCPVMKECLTWAYERENPMRSRWDETTDVDDDRYGVFAVPGKIRERFAGSPDRVQRCLDWFEKLALERGWRSETPRGERAG